MSKQTVLAFIDAINAHDVGRIVGLMTEDHVFIDAYGGRENKEQMTQGWHGYFQWFPDYTIEVRSVMQDGEAIGIFGYAGGTYGGTPEEGGGNRWRLLAAWRAVAAGGKVRVWQVYCDSKIPYEIIGRYGK